MPLPTSSLSIVCSSIVEFVRQGLDATNNSISVTIGAPAEVAKDNTQHRVSLFFYRFEPAGFGPDFTPADPWRIRLFCLITAFGVVEEQISAGDNELRLVGEVMRLFHETPVMEAVTVNDETVRLQVVFQPLGSDEINNIWSTQNDVSYRPSVAYEMALAPVVPSELGVGSPLVGAFGSQVFGTMDGRTAAFTGTTAHPPVTAHEVDTQVEGWPPSICAVSGGVCLQSVALEVGSTELSNFDPPSVWLAGDTSATVTLRWEVWDQTQGWRSEGPTLDTSPVTTGIDPDSGIPSGLPAIALPFTAQAGQAVLYAERDYTRGSDGAQLRVRSNPVLLTLYQT